MSKCYDKCLELAKNDPKYDCPNWGCCFHSEKNKLDVLLEEYKQSKQEDPKPKPLATMIGPLRPHKGWQCPKCDYVYSPSTSECYRCNDETNDLTFINNLPK